MFWGAAIWKQTAALKINVFCPHLHTVSIKGSPSGWTDSSVFLFLSVLFLFHSRICHVHVHEADPTRGLFPSFPVPKQDHPFPMQALRCRVRARCPELSVHFLCSSVSGAPVQVSPIHSLLPYHKPSPRPTRATCQHITLLCHGWNS